MATSSFGPVNRLVNPAMLAVLRSPAHALLSWKHVELTYTGRRSGRRYSLVTFYEQRGPDQLKVLVALPGKKLWWRNLTGEGGPVEVLLRGERRAGRAVATWDEGDKVARVTVELTPA